MFCNVFVLVDFNVHHNWQTWWTVLIFLPQVTLLWLSTFLFPAWILYCLCHSPTLLDLFWIYQSSDPCICCAVVFPPLGNSGQSCCNIDFLSNLEGDVHFLLIPFDYYRAYWNGLCNHLRDIPWTNIFKLCACVTASEFCNCF